jgi:TP901 family phage tail tape measure protein
MVMVGVIESAITLGTGDFSKSIDVVTGGLKRMLGAMEEFALSSLNASMDFNRSMANVGSLIPGNTARVLELKGAVQQMAEQTGKSTGELADGMYEMIGAFGDSSDSIARLRTATDLASAGLADTKDAMALIAAETRAYGDTSSETAAKVADLATMAVNLGQTTLPELAAAMPRVTALSSQMGVSFEEMNTIMATFTGVTGNAAEVGTQMRGMLQALAAPSEDMKVLFAEWGVETGKQAVEMMGLQGAIEGINAKAEELGAGGLQKLVGSMEGQTLAMADSGATAAKYVQNLEAMKNASGATATALAEQNNGIASATFSWNKLSAAGEVFSQNVGQVLEPAFTVIWDAMREGVDAAGAWLATFPELTGTIKAFAEGAVGYVKGTLVPGIVEAWPGIKQGFVDVWEGIKAFIAGDTKTFDTMAANTGDRIAHGLKTAIEGGYDAIKASFATLLDALGASVGAWLADLPSKAYAAVAPDSAMIPRTAEQQIGDWQDYESGPHALGGYISGAGTSTSDSIRAWLSNGEYVVNAAATAKNRPLLEAINAGRFAEGGIVGSAADPTDRIWSILNPSTESGTKNDTDFIKFFDEMSSSAADAAKAFDAIGRPIEAAGREMLSYIKSADEMNSATLKAAGCVQDFAGSAQDAAQSSEQVAAAMGRAMDPVSSMMQQIAETDAKMKSIGYGEGANPLHPDVASVHSLDGLKLVNNSFANTVSEKIKAVLGSFSVKLDGMFAGLPGAQKMFDQMNQGALQAQSGNTFFDFGALKSMQEGNLRLLAVMEKGGEALNSEWLDSLLGTSASWGDSLASQSSVIGQATEAQNQLQAATQSMIEPLQTASMGLAESAAASAAAASSGATFGQVMAISSQMVALGAGQMAGAFAASSMSMGLAAAGTLSMIDQQLARYGDVTTELGKQLAGGYGITGAVVSGDASGIGHGASFTPPPGWSGFSGAQGLGGGTKALSPGFGQQPNIIVQIDGEAVFRAVQNHAATYVSQNPGMWV